MRIRIVNILGLLVLFSFCGADAIGDITVQGQKDAASSRKFAVDVIALKDGKSVGDLSESDFELLVDGKKAPLRSLAYIQDESQKRLAVILHDMNIRIKNVPQEKDEITDALIGLAGQGIEMMIMRLDSFRGLKVIQSFTRDIELIRKASESAQETERFDESFDELTGRPIDTTGAEQLVRTQKENLVSSFYFMKRHRFEKTVGGLLAACHALQNSPGRKSVLLVSAGIPDISSSSQAEIMRSGSGGRETMDAIHERAIQTMSRTRLFDPFGLLKGESFERSDLVLDRLAQFSNAHNISIYTLDPGIFTKRQFTLAAEFARPEVTESESIQSEDRDKEVQNLRQVSDGTGGSLFRGANKFDDLRKTLISELNAYYELSFKPDGQKPDGLFHKISIKTGRKDVDLRFRPGYREYSPEEAKNLLLVSAYYSPELFHDLPFEGLFVPFVGESGKLESWINVAIPVKPLFFDRSRPSADSLFSLFIWINEREQMNKGFAAKIDIPIKMTDALRNSLQAMTYIWSFFKGPEFAFKNTDYEVVYVLRDAETGELGAWSSPLVVPDVRSREQAAVINCVLGSIASNPEGKKEAFALNPKNGLLEFGQVRFYPRVTNQFSPDQDAWVFLQAHLPLRRAEDPISPQFTAFRQGGESPVLIGELVTESWNAKTKVWSGIIQLSLIALEPGEHTLKVTIPEGAKGTPLTAEVKLLKRIQSP